MLQLTDTEMLDWLEENARGYGRGWVCRNSTTGRGLRLHETSRLDARSTVREAIINFIRISDTIESILKDKPDVVKGDD